MFPAARGTVAVRSRPVPTRSPTTYGKRGHPPNGQEGEQPEAAFRECFDLVNAAFGTNLAFAEQREERMTQDGIERYTRRQERLEEVGAGADRDDYSSLIRQSLLNVAERIRAELVNASQPRARGTLLVKILNIDPKTIAYISLAMVYSSLTKKHSELSIADNIGRQLNDEARFEHIKQVNPKLLDRLVSYAKKDYGSERVQKSFVLNTAKLKEGIETEVWPSKDQTMLGKFMLTILAECGLIVSESALNKRGKTETEIRLSATSLSWLEAQRRLAGKGELPMISPIYAPITVPPRDWTDGGVGGGYHTMSLHMVRAGKAPSYRDMPKVLAAINSVQATPWRLNPIMVSLVDDLWTNEEAVGKLPNAGLLPIPERYSDAEWAALDAEQQKGHRIMLRKLHDHNRKAVSDKISIEMVLSQAREFVDAEAIYLPCYLDYRGRVYQAPLLNPQGVDYIRAMFELASGKPLGDQGATWVAIQVASLWDGPEKLSKAPFQDRYEWTEANEAFLRAIVADPLRDNRWVNADKPFMFLRSAIEWVNYLDYGPSYVSRLPISMDASCSGIQHYSAMLRDEATGAKVNLLPLEKAGDVYADVAAVVKQRLQDAEACQERDYWLKRGVDRKVVKKPTMTYGYSSREQGFTDWYFSEYVISDDAVAPELKQKTARYLAKHTLAAVEEMLPSVEAGMSWLQQCVRLLGKEGKGIKWIAPSGFPVVQKMERHEVERVATVVGGVRMRISINGAPTAINLEKQQNAIGPNFVHSMDAAHLVLTVLRANEQYGITDFALIHDSFGTLAADADGMFAAVREAFVDMYQTNDPFTVLYDAVCEALSEAGREKLQFPPERGSLDISNVLQSLYCFA